MCTLRIRDSSPLVRRGPTLPTGSNGEYGQVKPCETWTALSWDRSYLKKGTGYDCAGQSSVIGCWAAYCTTLISLPESRRGATLAMGSLKRNMQKNLSLC